MEFVLDTGPAVTALLLDIADSRPEHNRHRKGYITASGERIAALEKRD